MQNCPNAAKEKGCVRSNHRHIERGGKNSWGGGGGRGFTCLGERQDSCGSAKGVAGYRGASSQVHPVLEVRQAHPLLPISLAFWAPFS